MKMPNCKAAVVDTAKLRDYCLNAAHPRGKVKPYQVRQFFKLVERYDLKLEDRQ
jgi:hypothetical protein